MIHPTAIVHPRAVVCEGAEIGPFCVIGDRVTVGKRTKLLAHVVVNGQTIIGDDVRIHPFCSIGAPSQDRKFRGEQTLTTIGDRTEIREYVSIHRATGEDETTSIGCDTLLLAYVHIAHNCHIGDRVTMSSSAQLAGHVIVEDDATVGGQAGVHQFVRIGAHSMVGGASKLRRDVPPYILVDGNPAGPYGLNTVGLHRAEFPAEVLAELKEAYRVIYRSNQNFSQAAEALRGTVKTEQGRRLLAFIEAPTERGIVK